MKQHEATSKKVFKPEISMINFAITVEPQMQGSSDGRALYTDTLFATANNPITKRTNKF
jgi:hypothetical protein